MVEAGASVAETEVEPVRHVPWITALEQLRPGGAPVACPVLPGQAGVGGEAESGREGPVGGEPLRAHPAPTPVSPVCPGSGWALLATTPTSDTSVCPTRVDTDSPPSCLDLRVPAAIRGPLFPASDATSDHHFPLPSKSYHAGRPLGHRTCKDGG